MKLSFFKRFLFQLRVATVKVAGLEICSAKARYEKNLGPKIRSSEKEIARRPNLTINAHKRGRNDPEILLGDERKVKEKDESSTESKKSNRFATPVEALRAPERRSADAGLDRGGGFRRRESGNDMRIRLRAGYQVGWHAFLSVAVSGRS